MLYKTRGIVLNYTRYRETSIIVKIYTEEFGLQTYVENGVRSARGKGKIALFQPLTLVDLVVYHKPSADIQRISEIRCRRPFYRISTDIKKMSLGIFVTEVLVLTLREHTGNPALFAFLERALIFLEEQETQVENFHLFFLVHLSAYLGFAPETARDLRVQLEEYGIALSAEEEGVLRELIGAPFGGYLALNKARRMAVLDHLIRFYRLNVEGFSGVRSVQVLKDVME